MGREEKREKVEGGVEDRKDRVGKRVFDNKPSPILSCTCTSVHTHTDTHVPWQQPLESRS